MSSNAGADSFGARVRLARRAKSLDRAALGALVGWPESTVTDVELDRLALERHSAIVRLADALEVDVVWLSGQPYPPGEPFQNAGHSVVPALRTALRRTGLILSGHSGMHAATAPQPLPALRTDVDELVRHRQAADLRQVMLVLPDLLEHLNTRALDSAGTADLAVVHRLIIGVHQVARMALNKLGYHDLAWTAVENAAAAAARSGDPLMRACAAWDRCGVLLHTGSLAQVITVAETAMDDLHGRLHTPNPQALSLYGALTLRCAVAASRRNDAPAAWQYLDEAELIAARLGPGRNDFQTVFGPGNVAIHATELAVELDQPESALRWHDGIDLATVPSKERHTRHRIDLARAYGQLGRDAAAVGALREALGDTPHYVSHHPLARALVENLLHRAHPTALAAGLTGLAQTMGLR
ncbi:helix-turn-helix protein [Nocardia tenerifensis]|uniref:Helix-turn-helix protein n=1 Tax=Nocardia tenerifensis TaxID=228006 RepID=A0A318K1W0_9NOCA|nr:helix-turn-helix transcriptional regulator [Nocardia tenerifensis]PXX65474.1 helix-turn-helix protein [Nocardia tenerifensis]